MICEPNPVLGAVKFLTAIVHFQSDFGHGYTPEKKLNTNNKIREKLQLEREWAAWVQVCKPDYPGTSDWQLQQNTEYKDLLQDLNAARYQTLLFERRSLIVAQKRIRKAAKLRAESCEASFEACFEDKRKRAET